MLFAGRAIRRAEASLLANLEAEATFGRMRVHREHAPANFVRPGRQRLKTDLQQIAVRAVDPCPTLVDPNTGAVAYLDHAERRFELFGEPERNRARCRSDGAANPGVGAVEIGMGICVRRS